jgi:C4-dicarboxylate-specific signal transduction histidine kinase
VRHPATAYEDALRRLSRCAVDEHQSLARIFAEATKLIAGTLGVERVGVWLFQDERSMLHCECLYVRSTDTYAHPEPLCLEDVPGYRAALEEHRAIAASNARTDPRTCELTVSYLEAHGITSMLDAPLRRHGEVAGVVCHEHVGPARTWSEADVHFASSVADLVALAMEQAACLEARKALEDQSRRYEDDRRMAALGRVAAAAAHDFNKLMTVVLWKAREIGGLPGVPAAAAEDARVIVEAVERSSRLTRQLAELGAPPAERVATIQLDAVVSAAAEVMRAMAVRGQQIEIALGAGNAAVRMERVRFDQILANLVSNALDATDAGSVIRIRTAVHDGGDGTWVVLQVTDDGPGIDHDTRAHIFEPYFTTKGERGRGLGLAIVHAAVQRAGGFVGVADVAPRGTAFTVHLPLVTDAAPEGRAPSASNGGS